MMGSSEDDEARAAKAASLRDLQQQVVRASTSPAKRKAAADADDTGSDSDDNDDDKDDADGKAYASSGGGDSHHRREKRLAMNRESARARRKRKKVLIESLEEQVAGLTEHNRSLSAMVEALVGKVRQLESELALSVLGRPPTLHGQGGGGAGSVAAANAMAAAAGIGQHARDVGSQEATLLRMLHGPQHSRLMESQLRAGDSLLRRGGPFDFHSLTTGAGDLEAAAAAPWDPYRTQLIGNNPSSMLLPTLQNTVRLTQVLSIAYNATKDSLTRSIFASRPAARHAAGSRHRIRAPQRRHVVLRLRQW
jgi:bZIP transcription factor